MPRVLVFETREFFKESGLLGLKGVTFVTLDQLFENDDSLTLDRLFEQWSDERGAGLGFDVFVVFHPERTIEDLELLSRSLPAGILHSRTLVVFQTSDELQEVGAMDRYRALGARRFVSLPNLAERLQGATVHEHGSKSD